MSTNNDIFKAVPLDEMNVDEKTNTFTVKMKDTEQAFKNGKYTVRQSSCLDDEGIQRASDYSAMNLFDGTNTTLWNG